MNISITLVFTLLLSLLAGQVNAGPGEDPGARLRQRIDARLRAMDTDGDGAISKQEYMTNSEKQFERMDLDGDGRVTRAELEQLRERWRQRRGTQFP